MVTAEIPQLMLVEGVGESTAVFLRMQGDLFRRLRLHRLADTKGNIRLTSPVEAARYTPSQLSLNTYETVLAVCLNAKRWFKAASVWSADRSARRRSTRAISQKQRFCAARTAYC
ncbi:MAG: hypothetical protein R2881_05455 [Eubacteriales bacterium]